MRVAVTGGSGFIGSHVVEALLAAGHEVRVLDLAVRSLHPRADYVEVDILDLPALSDAVVGCEVIFHVAGVSNVDHAFTDPVRCVRVNVDGTAHVLEAARRTGARRVVLASTVWVYGATCGEEPLTEEAPVTLPRAGHVYTFSKIAAEMLLHSYHEMYGQPFTILRYGIPYGPGMRDELVLARFVQRALAGQPLTLAGDGRQFRNYVYVKDLADAHVRALSDAADNEVFALEGDERVSIRDMAEAVRELLGDRVTIEYGPARPGDFRGRAVSNAKAERLLGWRPVTPFREGVRQYVDSHLASRHDVGAGRAGAPVPAVPPDRAP